MENFESQFVESDFTQPQENIRQKELRSRYETLSEEEKAELTGLYSFLTIRVELNCEKKRY